MLNVLMALGIDNSIMKKFLLSLGFVLMVVSVLAQSGKNGDVTISTANAEVNAYTTLTADAAVGSMRIKVASNTLTSNFSGPLEDGDLIFIYQAQGATINGTLNGNVGEPGDISWGEVLNYNNCGNYEFVEVRKSNSPDSIGLACALTHDYTAAGKVQIVRVPRYNSLTVNSGASITCPAWNGSTGGLVIVEVKGQATINGSIDASAKGFRGGSLIGDNSTTYWPGWASTSKELGAEKGEGIGGYQSDYDSKGGKYARGAAANAGGGGNAHNAGGGGGANGGNIENWSGFGVPDATYNAAWALESPSISGLTSSGGGKGGYTFSDNNCDAMAQGPGDACWGGDSRRPYGGTGGRPLDYSTGKLFFGGGGGAGDQNNNDGGDGGSGGGLIFIESYEDVTGTGSIVANGSAGEDTDPSNPPFNNYAGNDGAGGGGAGGTVIVSARNSISNGLSIMANGGDGGDQVFGIWPFINVSEAEGPGGGGGGGYVSLSIAGPAVSVLGGANGITESPQLTEFPPNGATSGSSGESNTSVDVWYIESEGASIPCNSTSATLTANVIGSLPSNTTITWHDAEVGGNLLATGSTYNATDITSTITVYLGTCPGHMRVPVDIQIDEPTITLLLPFFSLCGNDSIEVFGEYQSTPGQYYDTLQGSQGCDSVVSRIVMLEVVDTSVTEGLGSLSANAVYVGYQWIDCNSGEIVQGENAQTFEPMYNGSFAVEVLQNGCKDTSNCHSVVITGINQGFSEGMSLFPNPVNDLMKIDLGDIYERVELSIYSVSGQLQFNKRLTDSARMTEISTMHLAPGIYLLEVRSDDRFAVIKFHKY